MVHEVLAVKNDNEQHFNHKWPNIPYIDFLRSKSFSRTGLNTVKNQGTPL